jgi:hypothetical protein
MSHEHIGPGGYLLTQEAEVDRMAGNDYAKRERVKMAGWIKPAAMRQQMITGILQMNVNFIFCFRAKEKTKPKKGGGIEEMGFMPIAGEELLFEMTVNCLLPPKSNGIPQWRSDQVGERLMMKLPRQFEGLFAEQKPLDESIGRSLAEWARGGSPVSPRPDKPAVEAAPANASPDQPPAGAADIPTAAQYHQDWARMILNATRPDQLASTWNGQKAIHKQIAWTEQHSYEMLKASVMGAINSMKAPA